MKRRPDRALRPGAAGAILAAIFIASMTAAGSAMAQALSEEVLEEVLEDWYRIELLVFLREDAESLDAEGWDPLPELAYPEHARFLIDPELADRRLEESVAYASTIDRRGVQHLLLPAAFSTIDETGRPDSLILEPYRDAAGEDDPVEAGLGNEASPRDADSGAQLSGGDFPKVPGSSDQAPPGAEAERGPFRVALAHPFQLLDTDKLDFRAQARSLRRQGRRIAFHGAWWMRLPPDQPVPAVFLDRGADADGAVWPDLQGSVRIDRSRYLHIDVDLWVNTLAGYLPDGWQIDVPPLPPASIVGRTLTGRERNPWAPEPVLAANGSGAEENDAATPPGTQPQSTPVGRSVRQAVTTADTRPGNLDAAGSGTRTATQARGEGEPTSMAPDEAAQKSAQAHANDDTAARVYPWRHAIVHRQSRRMRSDEVHYLDHPVIGVVVKLRPADRDLAPVGNEEDIAFWKRHGLPVDYVEAEEAADS